MQKIKTQNNDNLFWGFYMSGTVPHALYSLFHLNFSKNSPTDLVLFYLWFYSWRNWGLEKLRVWSRSYGTHNVLLYVCWFNPFYLYRS